MDLGIMPSEMLERRLVVAVLLIPKIGMADTKVRDVTFNLIEASPHRPFELLTKRL